MKRISMMMAGLALVLPAALHAQCAGGGSTQPTLGIYLVECDCTVGSEDPNAWRFRTPPKVLSIAQGSAAEGVLREGDVILQVGDRAITTAEGAVAFARARTASSTQMLIQRAGRTQHVTLRPTEMCPNVAQTIAVAPGTLRTYRATPLPAAGVVSGRTPTARATQDAPTATRVPMRASQVPGVAAGAVVAPSAPGVSPWIGIAFSCSDCTADTANRRWIFRSAPEVYSVESGSPAYVAGLRRGDVLTHVDGVSITSDDGGRRWAQMKAGVAVRVNYTRAGTPRVATIRPGDGRRALPLISEAAVSTYRAAVESSAMATLREYERLIQEQNAREKATMQRLLQRELGSDSLSRSELETVLRAYASQQEAMQREREARTQELMRAMQRNDLVLDTTRWTASAAGATRAATQRLRFSGALGGAEVEVRGSSSVVVTERSDEIIITTSDATIRVRVPKREQ